MKYVWQLTKKNIRLLVRAKSSALIVFFAPLLIILIVGLAFNTSQTYQLNIGVNAPSFSGDVNSLITSLEEEEFTVIKYEGAVEDCVEDLKAGIVHTCISLPASLKVEGNTPVEVTFHIDPSKINLVWMIQQTLEKKFDIKAQEISQQLTGNILTVLANTKTNLAAEKGKIAAAQEKSNAVVTNAENTKSALAGLDLSVSTVLYDTTLVNTFNSNLTTNLEASISKINSAKNSLEGIEDSSAVISLLDEAKSELNLAKNSLNSSGVADLIISLRTDLDNTRNKLNAASEQITASTSNLDTIKSSLSEASSTLANVQTALDGITASIDAQPVTEAGVISNPLVTKIEPVAAEKTYLSYMFPVLLLLVIMFSSLVLGTTLVMMEKNSPAFIRNFFVPIKKITFILSTYLTNVILILLQVVIILGLSLIFIKEAFLVLPFLALILFLAASIFTFLGMALGYLFVSEETGLLASLSLGSLLLFLSGTILPLESASPFLRELISFNPFVVAEKLIREVFIFQSPFSVTWPGYFILLIYVVILFVAILIMESLLHKHLIHRFMKQHHKLHKRKEKAHQ